ncbi:hypothetical protein [uncultured Rikenella sp.]|nr:hypothetical protein [uncultured Rikenella sp.]
MNNLGSHGYSWCSTIDETGGMFLYFHPQSLIPNGGSPRAFGFQLRCLSE